MNNLDPEDAFMNQTAQPPQPVYVLRGHASQVHGVKFWRNNTRLLTGDSDGWIALWDVVSRRPVAVWQAHSASILGLEVWGKDKILTHGRDECVRVWSLPLSSESTLSKALPAEKGPEERPIPWLLHSLSVNTMNFCPLTVHSANNDGLYVAAPSKALGETAIFSLPSDSALHHVPPSTSIQPSMQMALRLCILSDSSLCLITAAESGAAIVQVLAGEDPKKVWTTLYCHQAHTQPVMGLDYAKDLGFFYTCSADSIIAKHPFPKSAADKLSSDDIVVVKTGHAGQQGLSSRVDEKIFATAGWDTRVRVYSCKTMKEVAVLKWHKEGCYAVAFANIEMDEPPNKNLRVSPKEKDESGGASDAASQGSSALVGARDSNFVTVKQRREQKTMQTHWLAVGSKDGKVSLWDIF